MHRIAAGSAEGICAGKTVGEHIVVIAFAYTPLQHLMPCFRVNCEAANVDKTVDAALEQRRAIQILRDRGALETLSPKLREAAQLREAHPELSLAQLAALCEPPVTKSSLSHRLRKLIQLSAQDTAP